MMKNKNILLLYDGQELDRQVLKPVNYLTFEECWKKQNGGNVGNKLFTSAIEQYLTKDDITYSYYTGNEKMGEINERYDIAILPLANIFNAHPTVRQLLESYIEIIEQLKIPTYIIGCGLQCDSYDDIGSLADILREPVKRLLHAIYQAGGELAVRGYATKEFLDKIMQNSAEVTGCPSLYQKGSGLQITNRKIEEKYFKPVINGNLKYLRKINMLSGFERYKNSIYLDQDEFAQWLYFKKLNLKDRNVWELVRKKTYFGAYLLTEDRIKLIYDIPCWLNYLETQGFHFSCGSRIHGNIAAMLAGIPSMVLYRDARTRELAEFIELPCYPSMDGNSIYESYLKADYSSFNKNFVKKFKNFEKFLISHEITHDIEDRTLFDIKIAQQKWDMPEIVGEKNIEYLKKKFCGNERRYRNYDILLEKLRKRNQ
ncbi:polysaccharide pyruvyl transferase family protein [bacterium 1xD8-48]|nr:polysaccharide pyruvyl transferase family protein [bacterium 1xD8-48]